MKEEGALDAVEPEARVLHGGRQDEHDDVPVACVRDERQYRAADDEREREREEGSPSANQAKLRQQRRQDRSQQREDWKRVEHTHIVLKAW